MDFILLFLAILVFLLFLCAVFLFKKNSALRGEIANLKFGKSSQAVRFGKIAEQWLPFAEQFPFETEKFRFIGSPIDGIAFSEDAIIFCEFKSGESRLSREQERIKQLVQEKKVKWFEMNAK